MSSKPLDRQLTLFDPGAWGREERIARARLLADAIAAELGEPVRLTVHDNRCTMVSFRRETDAVRYRIHHMFLDAPEEVRRALAAFAVAGRGAGPRRRGAGVAIDDYVKLHRARIGAPRLERLRPRGRCHDLQELFDRLNAEQFEGRIEATIGWGALRRGRRHRSIKTGVYVADARLIRIHPALDRPEVPEYYVAAVVFHEMLHQAVPAVERGGRRLVHGGEFRRRERAYPEHERARRWEQENIRLLLRG